MLILKSMLNWDSEIVICSRFVNCDLVIWTQPSGPLCLWQWFVPQESQVGCIFERRHSTLRDKVLMSLRGGCGWAKRFRNPDPTKGRGLFWPMSSFSVVTLLCDKGPKWDLTAHPEQLLIRPLAYQGKPSNRICGVAQHQKTLSFFSNIYLWNRNSWSRQWWRKAERLSKASISKVWR